MEPGVTVLLCLITLFVIIIKSIFGFGVALVAMPLFTLLLPLKLAIGIIALLDTLASLLIFIVSAQKINLRSGVRIIAGMIVGTLIGTYILANGNPVWVSKFFGILLFVYTIYRLFFQRKYFKLSENEQNVFSPIVGLIGGISGGISNINGPPVIIFLESFTKKTVLRATLATVFLFDGLWRIMLYAINDVMTKTTINYVIILMPTLLIGFLIGNFFHRNFKIRKFEKFLLVFLLIFGLKLIIS